MARWDKFFGGMAQGIPVGYEMGSQYQENQRKQAEEKRKAELFPIQKDTAQQTLAELTRGNRIGDALEPTDIEAGKVKPEQAKADLAQTKASTGYTNELALYSRFNRLQDNADADAAGAITRSGIPTWAGKKDPALVAAYKKFYNAPDDLQALWKAAAYENQSPESQKSVREGITNLSNGYIERASAAAAAAAKEGSHAAAAAYVGYAYRVIPGKAYRTVVTPTGVDVYDVKVTEDSKGNPIASGQSLYKRFSWEDLANGAPLERDAKAKVPWGSSLSEQGRQEIEDVSNAAKATQEVNFAGGEGGKAIQTQLSSLGKGATPVDLVYSNLAAMQVPIDVPATMKRFRGLGVQDAAKIAMVEAATRGSVLLDRKSGQYVVKLQSGKHVPFEQQWNALVAQYAGSPQ